MDMVDIYDDLDEFHENEEKKSKDLLALEAKYDEALNTIEVMKSEKKDLRKKIRIMEQNLQSLLDTAKAEIKRKDKIIEELRREKDDICFRRRNVHVASGNQVEPAVSSTWPSTIVGSNQQTKKLPDEKLNERKPTHKISKSNVVINEESIRHAQHETNNATTNSLENKFQQRILSSVASEAFVREPEDYDQINTFKQEDMLHSIFDNGEKSSSTKLRMHKDTDYAKDMYCSKNKDKHNKCTNRFDGYDFMIDSETHLLKCKEEHDKDAKSQSQSSEKFDSKKRKANVESYKTQRNNYKDECNLPTYSRRHRSKSKDIQVDITKLHKRPSDTDQTAFKRHKADYESNRSSYYKDERDFPVSTRTDLMNELNKYTERYEHKSRSREHDRDRDRYEQKHSGIYVERVHSSRRGDVSTKYGKINKYDPKNDKSSLRNQNKDRRPSTENVRKKVHDSSGSLKDESRNRKRRRSTDDYDYNESRHSPKDRKEESDQDKRFHDSAEILRLELKNIESTEEKFDSKAKNVITTTDTKLQIVPKTEEKLDKTAIQTDAVPLSAATSSSTDSVNYMSLDFVSELNNENYSSIKIDANNDKIPTKVNEINSDENSKLSNTHATLDTPKKVALFDALFGASPKRRAQQSNDAGELLANVKEILDRCAGHSRASSSDAYTDVSDVSTKAFDNGMMVLKQTSASVEGNQNSLQQLANVASSDYLAACLPMRVVNVSDQVCNSPSSVISISSSVTTQLKIIDSPENLKKVINDKNSQKENLTLDVADRATVWLNKRKSKEDCLAECDKSEHFKMGEQQSCNAATTFFGELDITLTEATASDVRIDEKPKTDIAEKIVTDDDSITSLIDDATASIVADVKTSVEAKTTALTAISELASQLDLRGTALKKNCVADGDVFKCNELEAAIKVSNRTFDKIICNTIDVATTLNREAKDKQIKHMATEQKVSQTKFIQNDNVSVSQPPTAAIDCEEHITPLMIVKAVGNVTSNVLKSTKVTYDRVESEAAKMQTNAAENKKKAEKALPETGNRVLKKTKVEAVNKETNNNFKTATIAEQIPGLDNVQATGAVDKIALPNTKINDISDAFDTAQEKFETKGFEKVTPSNLEKAFWLFESPAVNDEITELDQTTVTTTALAKTDIVTSALIGCPLVEKPFSTDLISDTSKIKALSHDDVTIPQNTTADFEGDVKKLQHIAAQRDYVPLLETQQATASMKCHIRALDESMKTKRLKDGVPPLDNTTRAQCAVKLATTTLLNLNVISTITNINSLNELIITNGNNVIDSNKSKETLVEKFTGHDKSETAKFDSVTVTLPSDTTFSSKQNIKNKQNSKNPRVKAIKGKQTFTAGPQQETSNESGKVAGLKVVLKNTMDKKVSNVANKTKTLTMFDAAEQIGNLKVKKPQMQILHEKKHKINETLCSSLFYQTSSDESSSDLIPLAQLQRKEKIEIIENIRLSTLFNEPNNEMDIKPKRNLRTKQTTFPKSTKAMITDKIDLIKPYSIVPVTSMTTKPLSNIIIEENLDSGIVETVTHEVELSTTPLNEMQTTEAETTINNHQNNINESEVMPNDILQKNNDEHAYENTTAPDLQELNELTPNNIKSYQSNIKTDCQNTKQKSPQKSYIKLDVVKASKNKECKRLGVTAQHQADRPKSKRLQHARSSTIVQTQTETTGAFGNPSQTSPLLDAVTGQIDLKKHELNTSDDFKEMLTAETSPLSTSANQMAFNDTKFVDIDKSMQAIFQSPAKIDAETSVIDEGNITINETVISADNSEQRELELAVSSILAADSSSSSSSSCCNNTTTTEYKNSSLDNTFESKRLSLGGSEYLIERVSENVVSMFITRKKRKKKKIPIVKTDA